MSNGTSYCYIDKKGRVTDITPNRCLPVLLRRDGYPELADELEVIITESDARMEEAIERYARLLKGSVAA